ncbi:MAG: Nramp family divalent metal transporter [Candidatus Rokubacteria bacterium]|nr:Nramp family divalent metal transporter [Candidatus Rokubacteria bacterium]MBI2156172.1 Nramp family divalent metal transporter [Candidatus Rokubacteria bacterium]
MALDHSHNPLVRYFKLLGPGLVTGASDDDPSGITTYSVAGASFGYGMLWTALLTLPLTIAVQLICARIGLVSGRGLAGAVRRHYPRPFLYAACLLLLAANVFNIAADLGGMAEAVRMLTGLPALVSVPLFGAAILIGTVYTSYATFARHLKWLTAVLFAYIAAAFLAGPDWGAVLRATFLPSIRWDALYVGTLVGVLGTTISPYLFFWQASQEVEEDKARGQHTAAQRRGATDHELADARLDVTTGIVFSNVVFYFIILTTGSTLYRAGHREIETARQAAEALAPLVGEGAYLLFTLGLVGTGLLAVPVLAGSASFAVAELFGWRSGLDLSPRRGRGFYLVFTGAVVAGMLLDVLDTNPIRMLFLSAVLNGVLAPPLLLLVMLVGNNRAIMGERTNGPWLNALGGGATLLMTAAAAAFFATSWR